MKNQTKKPIKTINTILTIVVVILLMLTCADVKREYDYNQTTQQIESVDLGIRHANDSSLYTLSNFDSLK